MNTQRNNIKAGLFVLTGLLLGVLVIFVLADLDRMLTPMRSQVVRFKLADGLQGLKSGAEVTIGHAPAGKVIAITDVLDDDVVVAKDVTFTIPSRYRLFDDAVIELNVPPLGTSTKLNIRSVGHRRNELPESLQQNIEQHMLGPQWTYDPGDPPLKGGISGSLLTKNFVEDLGIEDRQRLEIQGIIANIHNLTTALGSDPRPIAEIITNLKSLTASLNDDVPRITGDVRQLTGDLKGKYPDWFERIDAITTNADASLADAKALLASARAVVDANTAKINEAVESARAALADARAIAADVKGNALVNINTLLEQARGSLDDVNEVTARTRAFVAAQLPVLQRTLANARLTSDQLKLTAIEVRRAPWRLLYDPDKKELESDNLYDASRSFALAAGALDSTAESLQAVVNLRGSVSDANEKDLRRMLDNLQHTFEQFKNAEKHFWRTLEQYNANR